MNDVLEALKAARKHISKPLTWTQGHFARNSELEPAHVDDRRACRFCTMGAVFRVTRPEDRTGSDNLWSRVVAALCAVTPVVLSMADWNDDPLRTHEDVIKRFDAAIAEEERKTASVE